MSEKRDDGGPAYPFVTSGVAGETDGLNEGMSLWDVYATAALTGILASPDETPWTDTPTAQLSAMASAVADAMLAERRKRFG